MADDDEHHRADKGYNEGIAVEANREGLHQHDHPKCDQNGRQHFPWATAKPQQAAKYVHHLRTAPNVIPRSRCLRKRMVKTMTGTRKIVAPAATAGQSLPLVPMIVGIKGGAV